METKYLLITISILAILVVGGIVYISNMLQQSKAKTEIEKILSDIHKDLKEIKSNFPQLSDIDTAEIEIRPPSYTFNYERGIQWPKSGVGQQPIFEKFGCYIAVEIVYPEDSSGAFPEPPIFSANINGKFLTGMIYIYAESNSQGENFKSKVKEIIYSKLKEMENELKVKFNYFEQKKSFLLGERFTLKLGESAVEKDDYVPGPHEVVPERDYLEITNQNVVKRLLKPPGGEQRVVTLLLKKGDVSETVVLKESPTHVEGMAGLALTSWHGYLITLKDADAFGGTVVLEIIPAMEQ